MNKISGIIPSNARLSSVDLSRATPTRKGHPNVGQPMVETQMRGTGTSALRQAGGVYSQVGDIRQKAREQSAVNTQIETAFFQDRVNNEVKEELDASREEMIDATVPVDVEEVKPQEVGVNLSVVA